MRLLCQLLFGLLIILITEVTGNSNDLEPFHTDSHQREEEADLRDD